MNLQNLNECSIANFKDWSWPSQPQSTGEMNATRKVSLESSSGLKASSTAPKRNICENFFARFSLLDFVRRVFVSDSRRTSFASAIIFSSRMSSSTGFTR